MNNFDPLAFRRECGTCQHFMVLGYKSEFGGNEGRCRLNAPVNPKAERSGLQDKGVWPVVAEQSVCGQWSVDLGELETRARSAVASEANHWVYTIQAERQDPENRRIPDEVLFIRE